jgi:hypothetical protein
MGINGRGLPCSISSAVTSTSNVLAADWSAEGTAKSALREEIGAACFNARAQIPLGRTNFC